MPLATNSDDAALRFRCPSCQAQVTALPHHAGTRRKCPKCDRPIKVPGAANSDEAHATSGSRKPATSDGAQPVAAGFGPERSRHLALVCGYCRTPVFATTDQIGQFIVCPECLESVEVTAAPSNPRPQVPEAPDPRAAAETRPPQREALPIPPGPKPPAGTPTTRSQSPDPDEDEFGLAEPGEMPRILGFELDDAGSEAPAPRPARQEQPAGSQDEAHAQFALEPPPHAADEEFGVLCRVCGTRLYARPSEIGTSRRCPDCSSEFVVSRPPDRVKRLAPAARTAAPVPSPPPDDDDEYQLAALDEAPSILPLGRNAAPADPGQEVASSVDDATLRELDADQEFGFSCGVCGTRLLGTSSDVGSLMECPDCGTQVPVPKPMQVPRKWKPKVLEAEEDFGLGAPDMQVFAPVANDPTGPTAQILKDAAAAVRSQRDDNPLHYFKDAPPTAVLRFLFTPECLLRWIPLAFLMAIVAWLIHFDIHPSVEGPMGRMVSLAAMVATAVFSLALVAYGAVVLLAVVTDTANGQVEVQSWPDATSYLDWLGDTLFVLNGVVVLLIPTGMLASLAAPGDSESSTKLILVLMFAAAVFHFGYPVLLISILESASRVGFYSAPIWRSLRGYTDCWLLLYTMTAPISIGLLVCFFFFTFGNFVANLIVAPIAVGLLLVYFRLTGWVVWRIRERIETAERQTDADDHEEIPRLPPAISETPRA